MIAHRLTGCAGQWATELCGAPCTSTRFSRGLQRDRQRGGRNRGRSTGTENLRPVSRLDDRVDRTRSASLVCGSHGKVALTASCTLPQPTRLVRNFQSVPDRGNPVTRTASAVYGLAIVVSVAGLSAGCSSDESDGGPQVSTPTATVEGEPVSAIPAAFEGLDPCTLLTSEEARNATGAPSIGSPRRIVAPGQAGSMAACSWRPPKDLGVQLSFTTPPTLPSTNQEKAWTDEIGHPAKVSTISGACHAYAWYSSDRMVDLKIYPPEQQRSSSLEDDVCARSRAFIKQVFSKIPWK
ncbi:DUF3558 family protein [Nocardia sp. NPDC058480]|uniref:DUF3558 family protein n=1 Tax=unclassified Nocardia TaxID=2637762 RepID=UPI003646560A